MADGQGAVPMMVYYARPRGVNGSPQERLDIATLKAMGLGVIDPYSPEHQEACRGLRSPMDYFCQLASTADMIAFRSFPDGKVGAGLSAERAALHSVSPSAPVIEMPGPIRGRELSISETADRNRAMRESGLPARPAG